MVYFMDTEEMIMWSTCVLKGRGESYIWLC